ncbi:flagellar basal body P-ring formation chaperone FlgA [Pseudomonas fluvialis]
MKKYSSVFRRLPALALSGALSSLMALNAIAASPAFTTSEMLIGASQSFLEQRVGEYLQQSSIEGRPLIEIKRLDPRLRLAACDTPLSIRLESPSEPIGRISLRVRCDSTMQWTVFVPAQVKLYRQIVVASRPVKRQTLLDAADVHLAERDVGTLNAGYLTELTQAIGNKSTRPLLADQALTPNMVEMADVVSKGDQVVISASTHSMSVKMPGEALSDGAPGEQIRVRNLSSQRVIKARVTGPGQVEVNM